MNQKKNSALKLNNKRVVDSEGREIGVLQNMVVEAESGILKELMVKPAEELNIGRFKKMDGYILISFDAVNAIEDVIIVESEKMYVRA